MTPQLNVLYGVLTDGDNSVRKTTADRTILGPTASRIVTALMPDRVSTKCKRALAELYIRIIQSDKGLQRSLEKIDGINSYKLQSFREPFEDTDILPGIVSNIRAIGLPDEENSFLPFDYVKNALKALLEALNGNA